MLKILGCRGTNSVYGKGFNKYGSYTSSLISVHNDTAILLDMGTGVQSLSSEEINNIREYNIFFSHIHWDHLIGILGFKPIFHNNVKLNFYLSKNYNFSTLKEFLGNIYKPPFFPVSVEVFKAKLSFNILEERKKYTFNDSELTYIDGNHPNTSKIYKLNINGITYIYATDYEHSPSSDEELIAFAKGADFLIYDTTYLPEDYEGKMDGVSKRGWGHSTYVKGCEIAKKANVKNFVLFHHNPEYDDNILEKMHLMSLKKCPNSIIAKDSMII
jgi:ribonuclease BN (tRNA processing enzyme)